MRLFIVFLLIFSPLAAADDWPECKQRKLQSLRLEKALRDGMILRGYKSRDEMREDRRSADTWLWKQCRRYSDELRQLGVAR